MSHDKSVTLAQLTERFGLPADKQQGVYAWTNAHGDPSGDSALWTEAEAAELVMVWEAKSDVEPADIEYHADGSETVLEFDDDEPRWDGSE